MREKSNKLKLAVLISGGGTNLQAMVDQIEAGKLDAAISLVVSNNPEAYGLIRAENHKVFEYWNGYEKVRGWMVCRRNPYE